ncbi:MAG: hypothetical protein ABIT76_03255 [Chthoniobacterales bacterium]
MKKNLIRVTAGSFLILVALVTLGQCVGLGLNHDEHQFIAPAVLWAREGLLPYRDVPLFHQPYLIALDAVAVKHAASPLLAARLISGAAAFLTALLLFGCAWLATREKPIGLRLVSAISIVTLWLTSHLFLVASGRTWNHDLPSLLAISALAILLFSETPRHWHWLAAGLLAGLATGSRLTFAPFAGLLPLTALLWGNVPLRTRFFHLTLSAIGVALALLPSLWFYLQSPEGYLFGNFQFPRLPLLEADNSRILKTITPWRKMRFFFKEVVASNLPLALAFIGLAVGSLHQSRMQLPWRWIVPSLALVAGAFAPSRYEMQHFYIVAPLAALLAAQLLQATSTRLIYGLLAVAAISVVMGGKVFLRAGEVCHPQDWDVTRIHDRALDLRARVPKGKILTLTPIVVVESGLSIYPPLATGIFGWKFAHLVPPPRRERLGLLAPADLDSYLASEPPAAILTDGEEAKLEKPLISYAARLGYRPERLDDATTLWLRP